MLRLRAPLLVGLGLLTGPACLPPPVETGADGSEVGGSPTTGPSDSSPPADGPGATSMATAAPTTSAGPDETTSNTVDTGDGPSSVGTTSGDEDTVGATEASETSVGLGTTTSEPGTSTGEEVPVECLDPLAGIAWAGDWGKIYGAGCMYTAGAPDPFIVDASGFGNDCMHLMAEVWIPGVTDVDGNQAQIRTELVFEDPTGVEADHHQGLYFAGRFGNNYRYGMNFQGGWLQMFSYGTYHARFRFSYLEENLGCWYTIGLGDGPEGGAPRSVTYQL